MSSNLNLIRNKFLTSCLDNGLDSDILSFLNSLRDPKLTPRLDRLFDIWTAGQIISVPDEKPWYEVEKQLHQQLKRIPSLNLFSAFKYLIGKELESKKIWADYKDKLTTYYIFAMITEQNNFGEDLSSYNSTILFCDVCNKILNILTSNNIMVEVSHEQ